MLIGHQHGEFVTIIYKYKKQLQKIERKVGSYGVPKSIQTRVARMVTKVKDRPYFFLSSVFGCLFRPTSHFKLSLSNLVMMTKSRSRDDP